MIDVQQLSHSPGIYIHFPFCVSRCHYCDFATSASYSDSAIESYLACLHQEINTSNKCTFWRNAGELPPVDSVYFGGGTPSLMSSAQIAGVLMALQQQFILSDDCEITLEANPGDVTRDTVRQWQSLGINRISLGVQALDDQSLSLLGRRHNAETARSAMERVQSIGLDFGSDLIFGYPGQTRQIWQQTMKQMLSYCPDHLSCYQLTIEPDTVMARNINNGHWSAPGEELEAELFQLTHDFLTAAGYDHYEVSNFARLDNRRSRFSYSCHNTKYWIRAPYLGFGSAAHSFNGQQRRANLANATDYCHAIQSGKEPIAFTEDIDSETALTEQLFTGLRTRWGISRAAFRQFLDRNSTLQGFLEAGWLIETPERWIPSPAGMAVADYMVVELLATFS